MLNCLKYGKVHANNARVLFASCAFGMVTQWEQALVVLVHDTARKAPRS